MLDTAIITAAIEVLKSAETRTPANGPEEKCFLSAYQIACILKANEGNSEIVGGEGQAPHYTSRDLATELSALADKPGSNIQRAFFSTEGLDGGKKGFQFDGGKNPSGTSLSLFRWVG
jgi:hypothetical protein